MCGTRWGANTSDDSGFCALTLQLDKDSLQMHRDLVLSVVGVVGCVCVPVSPRCISPKTQTLKTDSLGALGLSFNSELLQRLQLSS